MGFIAGLFGSGFLKYLGAFTLVMVLLIVLASLVGGITYDTSDRSWGGWDFSITFNFGQLMEKMQERRDQRKDGDWEPFFKSRRNPQYDPKKENPEFNIPDNHNRQLFRPFKRLFDGRKTEPQRGTITK